MRELILLRHAHAESGDDDRARALSDEGRSEAQAAASWLAAQGLLPDRALCSPALRTRQTLDAVTDTLGAFEQRIDEAIYEATPGTLAELVDANRDAARLLLVGHNPGLEQLAALMYSGQSGDYRGMPPGGIAVLSLPAQVAIEPGVAQLSAFWWP